MLQSSLESCVPFNKVESSWISSGKLYIYTLFSHYYQASTFVSNRILYPEHGKQIRIPGFDVHQL